MAGVPGFDPSRLFQQLLNTGLAEKDQRLYQLIYLMIQQLVKLTLPTSGGGGGGGSTTTNISNTFQQLLSSSQGINNFNEGIMFPPGGISSGGNGSGLDYVVASDGALPTPSPVDDGFGNFVYVPYTP